MGALVAALIPLVVQYGPEVVTKITEIVRGNPQQQGEVDAAYIVRVTALANAALDDAAKNDAFVENS